MRRLAILGALALALTVAAPVFAASAAPEATREEAHESDRALAASIRP